MSILGCHVSFWTFFNFGFILSCFRLFVVILCLLINLCGFQTGKMNKHIKSRLQTLGPPEFLAGRPVTKSQPQ